MKHITVFGSYPTNLVELVWDIIGIVIVMMLFIRLYIGHKDKPNLLRGIVAAGVGLLALSFTFNFHNMSLKLPVVPLGVWILYLLWRKDWTRFRSYVWLGFGANFVFLMTALAAVPSYHFIYPTSEIRVVMADVEQASLIPIHPSGDRGARLSVNYGELLRLFKQLDYDSQQWYWSTRPTSETYRKQELFPYQLIGVNAKWGSGLKPKVYIQWDGKGVLVTTSKGQFYYVSEQTLLEVPNDH